MQQASYSKSNRWLTTLTIEEEVAGISRTEIIEALDKENIESRLDVETYAHATII